MEVVEDDFVEEAFGLLFCEGLRAEEVVEEGEWFGGGDVVFVALFDFEECFCGAVKEFVDEVIECGSAGVDDLERGEDEFECFRSPGILLLLEKVRERVGKECEVGFLVECVDILLHHEGEEQLDDAGAQDRLEVDIGIREQREDAINLFRLLVACVHHHLELALDEESRVDDLVLLGHVLDADDPGVYEHAFMSRHFQSMPDQRECLHEIVLALDVPQTLCKQVLVLEYFTLVLH